MSTNKNKEVVREFTRIFKNEHNVDGIDHLFHPDFKHNFRQELPAGLDGFKTIGRIMNGSFPDVVVTEEDLIAGEDKVIERSSVKGSHLGDQLGFPPTGKKINWTEIHIYQLKDEKIIQHWVEWSDMELFDQIKSDLKFSSGTWASRNLFCIKFLFS